MDKSNPVLPESRETLIPRMWVVYGVVSGVSGVIGFCAEEHNAARLVDLLNADGRLTWEAAAYTHIREYQTTHTDWVYPFLVQYIEKSGHIVKPEFIDFEIVKPTNERSVTYETSRNRESGILPVTADDDPTHRVSSDAAIRTAQKDLRSSMWKGSRPSRIKRSP